MFMFPNFNKITTKFFISRKKHNFFNEMTSKQIAPECRACLETNGELYELFVVYKEAHFLPKIIYECTSVQVRYSLLSFFELAKTNNQLLSIIINLGARRRRVPAHDM